VAYASPWPCDAAWRERPNADERPIGVEAHDVDRETHPHRVHRSATHEHERVSSVELGPAEQPTRSLDMALRDLKRPARYRHVPHPSTVPARSDASVLDDDAEVDRLRAVAVEK
jgi:hypothetical protein